jgi:tetratricopeptide (TPR) repeat protein
LWIGAIAVLAACARADEPGFLSKERWTPLTEVQFAELKAAENLFARKQYKAAKNAYEKFMTVHKTTEVVSYCQLMAAEMVRLQGKPNDAITDFQFVRDLAPDSDDAKWAHFRIAQCHKEGANVEKALATFDEIWKTAGTHSTAFAAAVMWVEVLEGQHKWKDRVPVWQGLVERFEKQRIEPQQYARAANGLALDRMLNLDMDGSYKLLLLIHKEAEAQSSLIQTARQAVGDLLGAKMGRNGGKHGGGRGKGPKGPAVVVDPEKAKENKGQAEKLAAAACEKAWGWIAEKPSRPFHQELVKACIDILLIVGKDDDAVSRAMESRKIYADDRWTFELVCGLYSRLDRLNDAIGQATAARRIHKDPDWALNLYAELVMESGDVDKAVLAWDQMKDKKAAMTVTSEALVETKMNEAIERRRKISEMDPKESTAVFMWIGKVLEKAKEYAKAIEEYRQARNEPVNLYSIGACLSSMKKHREAIGQYGEIGSVFEKETGNALYLAALEYEKLGEGDTAVKILRRVCRAYFRVNPGAASRAHVRLADKYKIDETLGGDSGKDPTDTGDSGPRGPIKIK